MVCVCVCVCVCECVCVYFTRVREQRRCHLSVSMKFTPWSARAPERWWHGHFESHETCTRERRVARIGCTTLDEHRKYFEKDAALDRRFQPIIVEEPSLEEAEEILFGLRQRYESFHNCSFTDEAVRAARRISARYISDRYLPDKAIDLLDEA